MAIYRLSIEVLQGTRAGDDPESHAAAVQALEALKADVRGTPGIILYEPGTTEAWGVPMRRDTFNLDFDSENTDEVEVEVDCMAKIVAFVTRR